MKKEILLTFCTLLGLTSLKAQIPNSGFELLDTTGTQCLNWTFTGSIVVSLGDSILTDGFINGFSTNAHSGNYALELRNSYNLTQNKSHMNGDVTCNLPDSLLYQGFNTRIPMSQKPFYMNLYYRMIQNPHFDTTHFSIKIHNQYNELIGEGRSKVWDSDVIYEPHSIQVDYLPISLVPSGDTSISYIQVRFYNTVSTNVPHVGQRVLIDDVGLSMTPTTINDKDISDLWYISPNPTAEKLYIHSTSSSLSSIELINTAGQILIKSERTNELNLSGLNAGIYFLRVNIDGKIASRMILKY